MNNYSYMYPSPSYANVQICNRCGGMINAGHWFRSYGAGSVNQYWPYADTRNSGGVFKDHGGEPYVVNINQATRQNDTFRTAIWTGEHYQVTLMSIDVGEDIGLEVHPHVDQFLRIEEGQGLVQMGRSKDRLDFVRQANEDSAIMVPAGTWHNVTNTGRVPLKLYSIYAPPNHPFGTVHRTKAEAIAAEG